MLNQIFPVIYQETRYLVDPSYLINLSHRFKEIIEPFLNHRFDISSLHLRITYEKFSARNINNFLKICQNLQTNVQDQEVAEICEIAIMFQSEKIFNTGLSFIQNNIDPNFSIPSDKLQELKNMQNLLIESDEATIVHHAGDLNELEFDDSYDFTQEEDIDKYTQNIKQSNKVPSACYQIKIENPLMKYRRFSFIKDNKILYTAKKKYNEIFISEGNKVHINENKISKNAIITQNCENYNIVTTEDQEFKIRYVIDEPKKSYSMKVTFIHQGLRINWSPKNARSQELFNGEYNHQVIRSKKNILLQNQARHTTFIVRKINKKMFEAECHPTVNPLIAFSIAISQIVGPHN